MAETTRDRFFDAINESYDALLTGIQATEARGEKVSRTLLEEARKGQQELVALARKWVDTPTSFFENIETALDAQARLQRRALELARYALSGAGEYRVEVREALGRIIKANRAATEATAEAVRDGYGRAVGRIRRTDGEGASVRNRLAEPSRVPVASGEAATDE